MSSLQAHLERHDVAASPLGFRRDCPLCRAERVQGHLPSASLVPPRARAAMAAALLAGSAVAPGVAAAADGQGVAAPAPAAPPPPQASDLTVGDGGAAPVGGDQDAGPGLRGRRRPTLTRRPSKRPWRGDRSRIGQRRARRRRAFELRLIHGTQRRRAVRTLDDSATVQQAPAEEPVRDSAPSGPTDAPERPAHAGPAAAPAPASNDGEAAAPTPASDDGEAAAPSESEPDPGPGPSSAVPTAAPRGGPAGTAQPTGGSSNQHRPSSGRRPSQSPSPRGDRRGAPDANRRPDRAGRTARDREQLVADETATGSTARRRSSRRETEPSATYRVRPGDSLWRIAERRLGASSSATATAQEVTRLWELNRQRIGTGNPDLILPGQTLRM